MSQVGKIYGLIPKIMNEVGVIAKDRNAATGGGGSYKFRGIDDVFNAFQPVLARNGVFCVPTILKAERDERQSSAGKLLLYTILQVQFRFFADDGSFIEAVMIGEAMDSGDKSANKAMSAAMKYAFFQVFCVPTEEEDNDTENQTHEDTTKKESLLDASISQVFSERPENAGAYCENCRTELVLSKAGTGYYCPRFKEGPEPHTRFPADQLQGVINSQRQERARARV
jgi:hypothetical protein